MIAIDLDGTLLSPDGSVTPRTKAAVHRALAAGYLVCFATGRNWTESRTVIEAVEHYATAVFAGGAMVIDTDKEVTVHRTLMSPELAREVSRLLESEGHAVLALQDRSTAGVDYAVSQNPPLNLATSVWMEFMGLKRIEVETLSAFDHDHTVRLGLVAKPVEARRVRQLLIDTFAERILCHSLLVASFDVEVLEVFDPGVNKWEGILHVARAHGIEPGEIIAIGDDMNDVAMLERAGLGVAMGNARPEAMAAARHVIGTNANDGLAAFLDELVDARAVEPERP